MARLRFALLGWMAGLALLLGGASPAFAMICGGGYSTTESSHTVAEHACFEYYFNNSGGAISSGNVVVFDLTGTGVNATRYTSASRSVVDSNASDGDVDNVGTYITTTTTDDSELVAGVVDDDSCADQSYCRVQVKGPRLTLCDATAVRGEAVATSTTAGNCSDAANDADGTLGIAMQSAQGGPGYVTWVNIRVSNTD